MGSSIGGILTVLAAVIVGVIVLGVLIYYSIRIVGLLIKLIAHVVTTLVRFVGDIFRLIGAVFVSIIFIPLVILNIVIGRWSASAHYGRAFTDECKTAGACLYRITIGHPLHLIGLRGLTEGIEQRLPLAVAAAPGADKPSRKRQGLFEGYTIVGSLQGGGSGGKLYVAEPDDIKRAAYTRRGHHNVDRVVIKTFSLEDGSSLPQIVRESRALDAAKKLGLVLEHDLSSERFFYIMRYVPGDSLTVATQNLHARSEAAGLNAAGIQLAVGYTADLLESLDVYHRGGLWHKDVKPDNLIVDRDPDPVLGRGKAHLVDFGLITPLRSAMTLTTHGTEYFRDPELVRQALRGVKVHQIDGGKFDIYAVGAVLFSIVENSFPAHGGLSQVSKKCPESIRWIIRRAMTDYDKRYLTVRDMLEDLTVVAAASDPYSVKPADLPSVSGQPPIEMPEAVAFDPMPAPAHTPAQAHTPEVARAASPVPPSPNSPQTPAGIPKLRVSDWWTGRYTPKQGPQQTPQAADDKGFVFKADIGIGQPPAARQVTPEGSRLPAKQQLKNARRRAAERRARVGKHRNRRSEMKMAAGLAALGPTARSGRRSRSKPPSAINAGVTIAVAFVVAAVAGALAVAVLQGGNSASKSSTMVYTDESGNTRIVIDGNFETPEYPQSPAAPLFGKTPGPAPQKPNDDSPSPYREIVPTPRSINGDLDVALLTSFFPPYNTKLRTDVADTQAILDDSGVYTSTYLFDGSIDEQQQETLAKLLAFRGQAPLDEQLGNQLIDFINVHDDIEAIWWVGPGDAEPYKYLLVTDTDASVFESNKPILAELSAAFIEQLQDRETQDQIDQP